MPKITISDTIARILLPKTFVLLFLFNVGNFESQSQTQNNKSVLEQIINIEFNNETLYDALLETGRKAGVNFSYNSGIINEKKPVSGKFVEKPLSFVLDSILPDSILFIRIGNQLALISKQDTEVDSTLVSSYLEISGKIINSENKRPVPFANVSILGRPIGTVSNNDGAFVFRLNEEYEKDTLTVSSIGFNTQFIPVAEIRNSQNIIFLEPYVVSLQEVIIRNNDPEILVRKAIEAIPDNYIEYPVKMQAFYREMIFKNEEVQNIAEGLLEIYKQPFLNPQKNDQVRIIKARSLERAFSDTVLLKQKAGIESCLLLDIVRNRPNFLDKESLGYYRFKLADIMISNEGDLYVIDFSPRNESIEYPMFEGRLFIEAERLTVQKAEFQLSSLSTRKAVSQIIVKKNLFTKIRLKQAQYVVNYSRVGSRFALSSVRIENEMRIRKRRKFFASDYKMATEFVATRIDTTNANRFRMKNRDRIDVIFREEAPNYSSRYWDEFNFIKPEQTLEDALKQKNKFKLDTKTKLD